MRMLFSNSVLSVAMFTKDSSNLMELSKKLPEMSEDEQYALLATNGMLVKRPLLVTADTVIPGFKEAAWEETLGA
mgnify:CR=1 FL=1